MLQSISNSMKPAKLISRSPVLNQATDRYIKLNQSLCAITPLPVKTMILKNDKCSMDVAFIHSFIHIPLLQSKLSAY